MWVLAAAAPDRDAAAAGSGAVCNRCRGGEADGFEQAGAVGPGAAALACHGVRPDGDRLRSGGDLHLRLHRHLRADHVAPAGARRVPGEPGRLQCGNSVHSARWTAVRPVRSQTDQRVGQFRLPGGDLPGVRLGRGEPLGRRADHRHGDTQRRILAAHGLVLRGLYRVAAVADPQRRVRDHLRDCRCGVRWNDATGGDLDHACHRKLGRAGLVPDRLRPDRPGGVRALPTDRTGPDARCTPADPASSAPCAAAAWFPMGRRSISPRGLARPSPRCCGSVAAHRGCARARRASSPAAPRPAGATGTAGPPVSPPPAG